VLGLLGWCYRNACLGYATENTLTYSSGVLQIDEAKSILTLRLQIVYCSLSLTTLSGFISMLFEEHVSTVPSLRKHPDLSSSLPMTSRQNNSPNSPFLYSSRSRTTGYFIPKSFLVLFPIYVTMPSKRAM
jgi:hypothetical protein